MQLCKDTRTNRQILFEKNTLTNARELMKSMLKEDKEIKLELQHFKYQIERLRKIITSNPVDMTKWLQKEKERLRGALPKVVLRMNVKQPKITVMDKCVSQAKTTRPNYHSEVIKVRYRPPTVRCLSRG